MTPLKTSLLLTAIAGSLALTACQSTRAKQERAYVERPVEILYNNAASELDKRDYSEAVSYTHLTLPTTPYV